MLRLLSKIKFLMFFYRICMFLVLILSDWLHWLITQRLSWSSRYFWSFYSWYITLIGPSNWYLWDLWVKNLNMWLLLQKMWVVEHFWRWLGAIVHFLINYTVYLRRLNHHCPVALLIKVIIVSRRVFISFPVISHIIRNVINVPNFWRNFAFFWIKHALIDDTHR